MQSYTLTYYRLRNISLNISLSCAYFAKTDSLAFIINSAEEEKEEGEEEEKGELFIYLLKLKTYSYSPVNRTGRFISSSQITNASHNIKKHKHNSKNSIFAIALVYNNNT